MAFDMSSRQSWINASFPCLSQRIVSVDCRGAVQADRWLAKRNGK